MHTALTTVRSTDRDTALYLVDPTTIDNRLPLNERVSLRLAVWLLVHSARVAAKAGDRQAQTRHFEDAQRREHRERTALRATVLGSHLD